MNPAALEEGVSIRLMNSGNPRIPSLDGLRAISIALVLISHATLTPGFYSYLPISFARFFEVAAGLGVRIFFVISGYIITRLLLAESERNGRINLRKFYYRRTLRIFPPFYFFLFALAVLTVFGHLDLTTKNFVPALTYTSNYIFTGSGYTAHSWSLSVEEQFYLLWPFVMSLFGRHRAIRAAASLILLCPLARFVILLFFRSHVAWIAPHFETVADAVATGCVLAGLYAWLNKQRAYARFLASKWFLLVPIILLTVQLVFANSIRYYFLIYIVLGITLLNICIALCVDWSITNHRGYVGRVLNSGPFVYVGTLSYSIYLWQELFLNDKTSLHFPWVLIPVFIAAILSYYLIEKPFLWLRQRMELKLVGPRTKVARSSLPLFDSQLELDRDSSSKA